MSTSSPLNRLQTVLRPLESVAVAFSGGVDSTLLLRVAIDTLGVENVLALTARSALRPDFEMVRADELAQTMGVEHLHLNSCELEVPEVAGNDPKRCYHCKHHVFSGALQEVRQRGLAALCDGTNLDDLDEYRPGHEAIKELGIRSPLVEAGLTKKQIREISRELGLPTWDQPSYSCLATRFPYGETLTSERLQQVETCEDWLRGQGVQGFRVRHHGDIARLEVPMGRLSEMAASPFREEIIRVFHEAGFSYVCLDLEGYRSGSMDIHLND